NSFERSAAATLFEKYLETHDMPEALFTTSFGLLQGVMDVTLRREGRLPQDLAIATFGDHELLDFLECPVLAVGQRHRDVAERVLELVLASLDEPRKPKPGLTRIRRNLYRRGRLNRKTN
ncbi:MAG TPA: catabolite repressor/activator, partial [Erwinia persicina]|nr:catabolite repressor/activator [Erwinia persicina]